MLNVDEFLEKMAAMWMPPFQSSQEAQKKKLREYRGILSRYSGEQLQSAYDYLADNHEKYWPEIPTIKKAIAPTYIPPLGITPTPDIPDAMKRDAIKGGYCFDLKSTVERDKKLPEGDDLKKMQGAPRLARDGYEVAKASPGAFMSDTIISVYEHMQGKEAEQQKEWTQ